MTNTIEVPVGVNCSLDGGPFFGFEGRSSLQDSDSEKIVGVNQSGQEVAYTRSEIQDILTDEMQSNEPIYFDTGNVDENTPTIELPCVDGYTVETYESHSEQQNVTWPSCELSDTAEISRFEKLLQNHGGVIK